jgi:CBS domain-containing protein
MRCEEVMREDVRAIDPTETVSAAAVRMRDENIGFLPVCDSNGNVRGTITDRDIVVRVDAEGLSAGRCQVGDVMTPEVVFVRREEDVVKAEQLMAQQKKRESSSSTMEGACAASSACRTS